MNRIYRTCAVLTLLGINAAQSQTVTLGISELIGRSDLIVVGTLLETQELSRSISEPADENGVVRMSLDIDAYLWKIQIQRVLKGEWQERELTILEEDPEEGLSMPRLNLFVGESYLLFLNGATADPILSERYPLGGRSFLFPVLSEAGVANVGTTGGKELLALTEQFLGSLPPVPPETLPVASMIDSAVVLKHQALAEGKIADENFVKELDNGLENALRHLAREDSVICRNELLTVQDKIRWEHERSGGKGKNERFVTEDGYVLLYYWLQYTIDRLPGR